MMVFKEQMIAQFKKHNMYKINTTFCGEFEKVKSDGIIRDIKYMNTKNTAIFDYTDFEDWFKSNVQEAILVKLEEFETKESGWSLNSIINLEIGMCYFLLLLI